VASATTWVQWRHLWQATPRRHRLSVRATDGAGVTLRLPPSDGATAYHTREVDIG